MRRTKIVCTIGPASDDAGVLARMIGNGMNVARLNFSHGTHAEHGARIRTIREEAARAGRPVAILQDLAGPKIRIGAIPEGPIVLEPGSEFVLTNRPVIGNAREVSLTYADLPRDVKPGDTLLLSDGALELQVIRSDEHDILCRTVVGGPLSSHKGINVPTTSIRAPILSDKDRADLLFGIEQEVDYVALSFVRSVADIEAVRSLMRERNVDIPIIAKIEKHEALREIDAIVEAVDGIMVARGDLSVEIPMEKVPRIQKSLIDKTNRAGKPVITATQMLLSMVNNPRPTRAEVADVANAVMDGTDAVMLSEESAMGRYPAETVAMMARIAREADAGFPFDVWNPKPTTNPDHLVSDSVADAAGELAHDIGAAAIITFTVSGATALMVAKYRPASCVILAPTPRESTYRRLALVWGVEPLRIAVSEHTDQMVAQAKAAALESGLLKSGDRVVITAGVPVGGSGSTNLIKVDTV